MNIVLIGYRGTGKSRVAQILAQRLNWPLLSTDAEIVTLAGCSIPLIVEQQGWDAFRDMESAICKRVGAFNQTIIDTGGGAILRQENVAALRQHGRVFWLTATVPTIMARIQYSKNRPSLTQTKDPVAEVEDVLAVRLPLYQAACDQIIPTDNRSLKDIADDIQGRL